MIQFVPKTETRFWRLFRCLLVPIGIGTFLISLVCGIAAAGGESAVFYDGRPVTGFAGFMLSFGYWPFEILAFTTIAAWLLFMERVGLPWARKVIAKVFETISFWSHR
jgi:hypothetical protein